MIVKRNLRILLTGVAGFIGRAVAEHYLQEGWQVLGIDRLPSDEQAKLRNARLESLEHHKEFRFVKCDISDCPDLAKLVGEFSPDIVVHLAAKAGVRDSVSKVDDYTRDNLVGFSKVINAAADAGVRHFVYASSSSVYGASQSIPFSENDCVRIPLNPYAASKLSNELFATSYSHTNNMQVTGLRFFSVYGPWGRPDMAPWIFAESIRSHKSVRLINRGLHERDYTYIGDVVKAVSQIIQVRHISWSEKESKPNSRVLNVSGGLAISTENLLIAIENSIGMRAQVTYLEGDSPLEMSRTIADLSNLRALIGDFNQVPFEDGIREFIQFFNAWWQKDNPPAVSST